ncbi:hypothetical protein [uncultured Bacteroides sp.]|uniref:hypothetical protein n=1 Tax=uncultured Bacteroides sp. TaxID=162156 RepID=UPI0025912E72|nr:hypothetical protein [uncultured Bacteroides sp.]
MNIQEKLLALGISEQEMLHKLRGAYNTSFFHIYIAGDFNTNLNLISQQDRGTFIHEYIHYWQNIGTLWGLATSILNYEMMLKLREEIAVLDEIKLPYSISPTERMKRLDSIFRVGNGFFNDRQFYGVKIDQTKRIGIKTGVKIVEGKNMPIISLIITFENNVTNTLELGAHIIKESMAALYQSLVDPDAGHDDIPYNVVRILCKHNYPSLYDNKKLLICCCYAALFSMTPGDTLISLLAKAEKEQITDGMQLFADYIDSSTIAVEQKKGISVTDFFDGMANHFLKTLDKNLLAQLDYIKTVLERVRLSNRMLPLLTVLYEEKTDCISIENLNEIINWLGIPYVQTQNCGHHNPATATKPAEEIVEGDDSMDVLELIAVEAMYLFLTKECPLRCCPLYGMMCSESPLSKPECFDTPWLGKDCIFTIVSSPLELHKKNIHW